MKSEYRLFIGIAVVLFLFAALYGGWTAGEAGAVEWVGTVALILSGLLTVMAGGYFWFVSRRIDLRPEDRLDAEIEDGAGEIGFFSPGSYYPFGLALCALITGLGLVFWQVWLIAFGAIAVIFAAAGLLFEYYTGTRRSAEH
jgi:hypothetical protein